MATNKIEFEVGMRVNSTGFTQLENYFKEIQKMTTNSFLELNPTLNTKEAMYQLREIKNQANVIETALNKAFNPTMDTINFSKFKNELNGLNLSSIQKSWESMGIQGEIAFRKLATQVLTTNTELKKSSQLLNNIATTFKNTVKWGISSSVFNNMTGSLQKAWGYTKALDNSLNNIRIVSGRSADEMARFAVEANRAAQALGSSTTDYTDASLIYYQQGLSTSEVVERTNTTIKMANALGASAQEVSDYMTAIWNNFDDGSRSLEHYADVITALGASTASSSEEIADGLEKFASIAGTVGLSYEYATSALATVVAATRQSADTVGTAFKTLFARIQGLNLGETLDDGTTLNKYSEALEKVGINIKDSNGELKKMDDILDEMGKKWRTLNSDQQIALAQTVAGVRQYNQLMALMDNWDDFGKNLTTANTSTGTLQKQQDTYLESTQAHLEKVGSAYERLLSALGKGFNVNGFLDGLADVVTLFSNITEGIGGGQNALLLLGSTAMRVFDTQISAGLINMSNNFKVSKDGADSLRLKLAELNGIDFSEVKNEGTKLVIELEREVAKYAQYMSKSQQDELHKMIQGIEQAYTLAEKRLKEYWSMINNGVRYNREDFANNLQKRLSEESPGKFETFDPGQADFSDVEAVGANVSTTLSVLADSLRTARADASNLVGLLKDVNTGINKVNQDLLTKEKKQISFEQLLQQGVNAGIDIDVTKYEQFETELEKIHALAKDLNFKDYVSNFVELQENARAAAREMDAVFETRTLSPDDEQILADVQSRLYSIGNTPLDKLVHKHGGIAQITNEVRKDLKKGSAIIQQYEDKIEEMQQIVDKALVENEKNKSSIYTTTEEIKNEGQKAGEAVKEAVAPYKDIDSTQTLVNFAASVGQVAAGFQSLVNVTKILNNDSLSTWEKILQVFTALATGLPSLISGFSTMVKSFSGATHAIGEMIVKLGTKIVNQKIEIELQKKSTKALNENTKAELENAKAKNKNINSTEKKNFLAAQEKLKSLQNAKKGSVDATELAAIEKGAEASGQAMLAGGEGATVFGAALGEVAIAAAAVVAVVAVLAGVIAIGVLAYTRTERAAKRAAKTLEGLRDAYQACNEELETFNSLVKTYDDAVQSLDELTEGTKEYEEALKNANDAARELIEANGLYNNWKYDSKGLIVVDTEAARSRLKENQSSASVAVNAAQIQSNTANTQYEATKFVRDVDTWNHWQMSEENAFKAANALNSLTDAALLSDDKLREVLVRTLPDETNANIDALVENRKKLFAFAESVEKATEANNYYSNKIIEEKVGTTYSDTINQWSKDKDGNEREGLKGLIQGAIARSIEDSDVGTEFNQKQREGLAEANAILSNMGVNLFLSDYTDTDTYDKYAVKDDEDLGRKYATNVKGWKESEVSYTGGSGKGTITNTRTGETMTLDDGDMRRQYASAIFENYLTDLYTFASDGFSRALPQLIKGADALGDQYGVDFTSGLLSALASEDGLKSLDFSNLFTQLKPEDYDKLISMSPQELAEMLGLTEQNLYFLGGYSYQTFADAFKKEGLAGYSKDNYYKVNYEKNRTELKGSREFTAALLSEDAIDDENEYLKKFEESNQETIDHLKAMYGDYYRQTVEYKELALKKQQELENEQIALTAQNQNNTLNDIFINRDNIDSTKEELLQYYHDNYSEYEGYNPNITYEELRDSVWAGTHEEKDEETGERYRVADDWWTSDKYGTNVPTDNPYDRESISEIEDSLPDGEQIGEEFGEDIAEGANDELADRLKFDEILANGVADVEYHLPDAIYDDLDYLVDRLDEIANKEYMIKMAITDDIQSDFDNIISLQDQVRNSASMIGDNYIVAAEDIEELNDAFPGILKNATILADGTMQLNGEVAESSMAAAQQSLQAETDAVVEKLKLQQEELEARREVANNILQIAIKAKEGEISTEEAALAIQGQLDQQEMLNDKYVTDSEKQNDADVADTTAINAEHMANSMAQAYQKMADDSAKWAEAAKKNLLVATTGVGSVNRVSLSSAWKSSVGKGETITNTVEGEIKDASEITNSTDWDKIINTYTDIVKSYDTSINNVQGKIAEILARDAAAQRQLRNAGTGKGSGGNSGNKETKELRESELDWYERVNVELNKISATLKKLQTQEETLLGKDLVKNLNQQLATLNDQISKTQIKLRIANDEMNTYKTELIARYGAQFNKEGTLTNYADMYDSELARLNGLITNYNNSAQTDADKAALEAAEERFEHFLDLYQDYDELYSSTIPGLEQDLLDSIYEKIENQVKQFNLEIELRLKTDELEKDWKDFKATVIDGLEDDDLLGQTLLSISHYKDIFADNSAITTAVNDLKSIFGDLDLTNSGAIMNWFGANNVNNDAVLKETLEARYDTLVEYLTNAKEILDKVEQYYVDSVSNLADAMSQRQAVYNAMKSSLQHDVQLIQLLYSATAYDKMQGYYETLEELNKNQYEILKQDTEKWKMIMDREVEGSEAWKIARDNWLSAMETEAAGLEALINATTESYINSLKAILKATEENLTNGKGFGYLTEEWDLLNKEADEYLDTINAQYGIQQLQNKYLEAIDNSSNVAIQQKLNKLMEEQTQALKEQDKLSQYDLDRANKKYEIALKQIELEEAQYNKSTMRLSRDSQGNYSYQYVADEDQINSLRNELSDLYNQLYNLDVEKYQDNLNKVYSYTQECEEKILEVLQNTALSEEEKEEQVLLIREKYAELINNLLEDNEEIQHNLRESTYYEIVDLYGKESQVAEDYANNQDAIMSRMVLGWNSGIQEMINIVKGEGGFEATIGEALDTIGLKTDEYNAKIQDLRAEQELLKNGYTDTTSELNELLKVTDDMVTKADEVMEKIKEEMVVLQENSSKWQAVANSINSVIAAKEALLDMDKKEAEAAKKNKEDAEKDGGLEGNQNIPTQPEPPKSQPQPTSTPAPQSNPYSGYRLGGQEYTIKSGDTLWAIAKRFYGNANLYTEIWNNNKNHLRGKNANQIWPGEVLRLNTGGYTGDWSGSDGRMAMLHKKELVLNATDTENLLNAVSIIRDLTSSMTAGLLGKLNSGNINNLFSGSGMEQNVHIEANFPNATSASEIEDALNNLVNMAAQRVNERQ